LRGEIEIALERSAASGREVVEAVTDERIGEKAVGFDGVMAFFTDAEAAIGHAIERGIDFTEKASKPGVRWRALKRYFQARFALHELRVKEIDFH
jgi:hypothetical protein